MNNKCIRERIFFPERKKRRFVGEQTIENLGYFFNFEKFSKMNVILQKLQFGHYLSVLISIWIFNAKKYDLPKIIFLRHIYRTSSERLNFNTTHKSTLLYILCVLS